MSEAPLPILNLLKSGRGPRCTVPWTTLREQNLAGDYQVCCWSNVQLGRVPKDSTGHRLDLWDARSAQDFRLAMARGEIGGICEANCPVLYDRWSNFAMQEIYDYPNEEYAGFSAQFRANREKVFQTILAGQPRIDAFPLRLKLHPSNVCNLDCRMCGLEKHRRAPIGPDYLRDTYELLPYLEELLVFGGEPFACRTSREIIFGDRLRQCPQVHLSLITNGMLLDEKTQQSLARLRLGYVDFSLDSCRESTYHKIRVNAEFKTTFSNFERFVERRDRGELRIRQIAATFVIQKLNFTEIAEFVEFAHQRRATSAFCLVAGLPELLGHIGEVNASIGEGIAKARALGEGYAAANLAALQDMLPTYEKTLRRQRRYAALLGTGKLRQRVSRFFTAHPRLKRAVRALLER